MEDAKLRLEEIERLMARRRKKRLSPRRRWIRNIVLFLVGMMIPSVIFSGARMQCYRVKGEAMRPRLRTGDVVIASKTRYSTKSLPALGTVVLLTRPSDPEGEDTLFVKRVVARPGDDLEAKDGKLLRNGRLTDEPFIREALMYDWDPGPCPEGHVMVLGDNRNESQDSHNWDRSDSGGASSEYIPADDLIGQVVFAIWPPQRAGRVKSE